jgi:putative transferase (TIGR04331 family)
MSDSKILLLIKDLSNLNIKESYLNFLPLDPTLENKLKIIDIKFNLDNKDALNRKHEFCLNLYNKLIEEISRSLNKIHKVNFTIKEWNIIIGYWLKEYIYYCYTIYNQVKYVKKNYNIKKIFITDFKEFNFITDNTLQFEETVTNDLSWYLNFSSKIIEYFKFEGIEIKKNSSIQTHIHREATKIKKTSVKIFIKKILNNIFINLRSQKNAFIAGTCLPFFEEKKLEMSINYLPSFYVSPTIKYKSVDPEIRKKFKLNSSSELSLENFIKSNLHWFLPKAYLENFNELITLAQSKCFPQNPKFIFTSILYNFDEVFKVYAASKIKNRPLFIGQHGNNYFTQIDSNYFLELKFADKFFSWGYEDAEKKNIIRSFNFKTFNRKIKRNKKESEKIIILINLYDKSILSNLVSFIKKLKNSIREKVVLRLREDYFEEIHGVRYSNFFKSCGVTIDDGKIRYEDLIKNAKLCVFFFDSTGFLENYCYNIPSLIFENKDYLNRINDDFQSKYEMLLSNNIFFGNEVLLANHINNIWPNIDEWWNQKITKEILDKFNNNLNICGKKNNLKLLKSKLLNHV